MDHFCLYFGPASEFKKAEQMFWGFGSSSQFSWCIFFLSILSIYLWICYFTVLCLSSPFSFYFSSVFYLVLTCFYHYHLFPPWLCRHLYLLNWHIISFFLFVSLSFYICLLFFLYFTLSIFSLSDLLISTLSLPTISHYYISHLFLFVFSVYQFPFLLFFSFDTQE